MLYLYKQQNLFFKIIILYYIQRLILVNNFESFSFLKNTNIKIFIHFSLTVFFRSFRLNIYIYKIVFHSLAEMIKQYINLQMSYNNI